MIANPNPSVRTWPQCTMITNPNPSVRTWRHCLSGETRGKEESIVDRKHP